MTASKLYKIALIVSLVCISLTIIVGAVLLKVNDSLDSYSRWKTGFAMVVTGGVVMFFWVLASCLYCEQHETHVRAFGMTMSMGGGGGGGVGGGDGGGGGGGGGCSGGGGGGGG